MNVKNRMDEIRMMMFTDDDDRSPLREYGKPRSLIAANPMQVYLAGNPNAPDPSYVEFTVKNGVSFDFESVLKELKNKGWTIEWQNSIFTVGEMQRPSEIYMKNPEAPLHMIHICVDRRHIARKRKKNLKKLDISIFKNSAYVRDEKYVPVEGDDLVIDDITLFVPKMKTEEWKPEIVMEIHEILANSSVTNIDPHEAEINIVSISEGQYEVKPFSIGDASSKFLFPELHYGAGFTDFHGGLVSRITDEKKGLVLLHGEPGTGKTQYIRYLLKELCAANKAVLYAPPSVTASLAEPQMINFISNWIMEESRDCILLIEDAEPLLESRSDGHDGRSTGITNLLNMTDGILNDILGLMVIATFNIDIQKIDPALLRSGRLIARKEFKKLTQEQAESLAKDMDMTLPDDPQYPMSIADFYNSNQAKKILVHDYDGAEKKKSIGFR